MRDLKAAHEKYHPAKLPRNQRNGISLPSEKDQLHLPF